MKGLLRLSGLLEFKMLRSQPKAVGNTLGTNASGWAGTESKPHSAASTTELDTSLGTSPPAPHKGN